ncbi:MAG TPA: DUF5686 and carboxypeptidase regulatory-like domain-containing protein [Albibacterium sp.]|nr:DUF5686 and carboxypeptidase regulatory-like domain-containing protein [Albibacterium sp.]HUH19085.1 DUF5686 and carboxypeptidase regulatory-like domain-containing protein [Albibacterium sp.]
MKRILLLSLLILFCYSLKAQSGNYQLKGVIKNMHGQPIPFASIFKSNSTIGTSANSDGVFKLTLAAGEHQIVATAVGFRPNRVQVLLNQNDSLTIQLEEEVYTLQEVIIGNDREDPAYAIIRKAIKKRPVYLEESGPYTANVYIKGLQRLTKAPKKFFGVNIDDVAEEMGLDSNRTGIIYLSESESKITVNPPQDFKEEMISSKVSGDNRAFSFNRASDLQLNFYENYQPVFDGLSSRPFVSPIADNALAYYNYKYLGTSEENGITINKIRVIPKRKSEPLYKGDIYIVEDDWRIHSVNLLLDKEAGVNFIDSLNIKQLFTPVGQDSWMPSNVQLDFKVSMLGFGVGGYFTAIYQDYVLTDKIDKKLFKEVLRIGKDVNSKDADYWLNNRPIPLTEEESIDYIFKDSIRRRNESKSYLDSLDRKANTFKPANFLLGGYSYRNRYKKERFYLGSPLRSLLFNSVEGLASNYSLGYSKQIDSTFNRYLDLYGHVRYGFKNKHLNGNINAVIPIKNHTLYLSGGSDLVDLNDQGSLPVLFNTIATLAVGGNHQKLYEKTFVSARWRYTLPGNINLDASFEWSRRHWLPNSTNFTLWDSNSYKITSNNPFNPNEDIPLFEDHNASKLSLGLSYNFSNRYESYPSGKRYLPSEYPTLSLNYTKGVNKVFGSDADYDLLKVGVYKSGMGLGMYGTLSYAFNAGKFINNNKVYYPDFKHFNGNEILFVDQQLSSFLNLDYYQFSTKTNFVEMHTEYNMSGILTSKIPLLRKLKLEEIVGLHYLHTPELKQYGEVHLGFQWKLLRVIYAHSMSDQPLLDKKNTIRVGIKLF